MSSRTVKRSSKYRPYGDLSYNDIIAHTIHSSATSAIFVTEINGFQIYETEILLKL